MNTKSMIIIVGSLCFGAFVCGSATAFVLNAQNESTIPTPTFSPTSFSFQNNLKIGDNSQGVRQLQILLNSDTSTRISDTGIGSKGQESTYFGALTQSAVMRFQAKYKKDVLDPYNVAQPTGFVGPGTRKKLNELVLSQVSTVTTPNVVNTANTVKTSPQDTVSNSLTSQFSAPLPLTKEILPRLYTVRPQQVSLGGSVVLIGAGFEPKNTIHIGDAVFKDVAPQDGNNISFTIPSNSGLGEDMYDVWLENGKGSSKSSEQVVKITITQNPQQSPVISSVSPSIITTDGLITVVGYGFTSKNTVVSGFGNIEGISSNGSQITFSPKSLISQDIIDQTPKGKTIKFDFYIYNENGPSNIFGTVNIKP